MPAKSAITLTAPMMKALSGSMTAALKRKH
jgi:hypothetical protein